MLVSGVGTPAWGWQPGSEPVSAQSLCWQCSSFVSNSHLKACDSRMKDTSLRIQMFLRVNLRQFFQGKVRLVLIRTLLKNFRVALGEALQALFALGRWHIRNSMMCLGCKCLPSMEDCQERRRGGSGGALHQCLINITAACAQEP